MANRRAPLLPEAVQGGLGVLAAKLKSGQNISAEVDAATKLLDQLPPEFAINAERSVRELAGLAWWQYQEPSLLSKILRTHVSESQQLLRTPGLAKLFLFHGNGRKREAALQRLVGPLSSPFVVAAVIWRTNDWVPEVRRAAVAALSRTIPHTPAEVMAKAAISLLPRSRAWKRWDDGSSPLAIALRRPDVIERLAEEIGQAATGPTTRVLRAALREGILDDRLLGLAQSAKLPSVRAFALNCLLRGEVSWPSEQLERHWIDKSMGSFAWRRKIERRPLIIPPIDVATRAALVQGAANDKSALVRRQALQAAIEFDATGPLANEIASALDNDRSPSVRTRAAYILKQGQTGAA